MSSMTLSGKTVAFLATDGVEESELTKPWEAVSNAGAKCVLISLKSGEIQSVKNDSEKGNTYPVDKTIDTESASSYDALVLPGGVGNPDKLRMNEKAVQFVKDFFAAGKPVSAICHGPWLLVEAGVLKGLTVTSWPSLKTDITNAGGQWVDEEVYVDNGLTTSRKPDDLAAFCRKTVEEIGEGRHAKQAA